MVEQERPRKPVGRRQGEPVAQYRLYFLEGHGALISYSHEFEAKDDEEAARISEAWREGRRAELWCGSRKVKSWDHTHDR